jgi:hypothetical protein
MRLKTRIPRRQLRSSANSCVDFFWIILTAVEPYAATAISPGTKITDALLFEALELSKRARPETSATCTLYAVRIVSNGKLRTQIDNAAIADHHHKGARGLMFYTEIRLAMQERNPPLIFLFGDAERGIGIQVNLRTPR